MAGKRAILVRRRGRRPRLPGGTVCATLTPVDTDGHVHVMTSRPSLDINRQGGRQVDATKKGVDIDAATAEAVYPGGELPGIGARAWMTRAEAAAALKKEVRTIDRMLEKGRLTRLGEGVPVKISKESVERVAGDLVAARRTPTIIVEQAAYDALLMHKERLESQLRDREQRLLVWEGQVDALTAAVEEERAARADAEVLADQERQERERLANELEALRSRGFWSRLFGKGGK